jgi:hypothetical protein
MTAKLTIVLSDEVLKALRNSQSISIVAGSDGGAPPAARPAPAATAKAGRTSNGKSGPYREGSLPAKLMAWAGGLKKPFGIPDLMRKFKIKRGHASMLIAYVTKGGAVKRVGRGEYVAA